jgi:hypothetical protein
MKNALGLILLAVFALGQLPMPLRSLEVFNTGAFECTREKTPRYTYWTNNKIRLVRKGQLWMGMNGGTVADFGFAVRRERDKTMLFRGNWDHYAEPTGINDQIVDMDFSPDYILLLPGDKLALFHHCQSFGETPGAGHVIVTLWYFP